MAITFELYEALKSVGVDEEKAKTTAEKFENALENRVKRILRNSFKMAITTSMSLLNAILDVCLRTKNMILKFLNI